MQPGRHTQSMDPMRLRRVLKAYTTRFVAVAIESSADGYHLELGSDVVPRAGDVVLARVVEIGKHTRLESPVSRRQLLFPGREILVAYGDRYAPDQFLAHVPESLAPADLVAGGGLASQVIEMHASIDGATRIEPLGLLADRHGRVTLDRFAPLGSTATRAPAPTAGRPPVIAVFGSSMNSGKSTVLGSIVNGFVTAGLQVAAGKSTGTGAGNDPHHFRDAGASTVLDFTDFGHATTYRLGDQRIREIFVDMVDELAATGPDVVIIEVADGVYQEETRRLLEDPAFHERVDRVVFASQDALGAVAGMQVLDAAGVTTSAVSGVVTSSPLATSEAGQVLSVPVIGTFDLREPHTALGLLPKGLLASGLLAS
ncbi:malic enzyme protein [Janibacter sp. Soil728]|nr:malic enzyme protein [Janibacter sp. Soil728]